MMTTAATSARGGTAVERDPRWAAVSARDRAADGTFFYSVATTGVYCRPSCPSRRANPRNVRFHRTAAEAERAGFRPCKRCRPTEPTLDQVRAATIARICRLIDSSEATPALADLAGAREDEPVSLPSRVQGDHRRHPA